MASITLFFQDPLSCNNPDIWDLHTIHFNSGPVRFQFLSRPDYRNLMVGGRGRTVYIKFTNQLTEMFFVLGNDAKDRQPLSWIGSSSVRLEAWNISHPVFIFPESLFVGPIGPGLNKNPPISFYLRAETLSSWCPTSDKTYSEFPGNVWRFRKYEFVIGFAWLALKDEIWITDKICWEIHPESH